MAYNKARLVLHCASMNARSPVAEDSQPVGSEIGPAALLSP